MLAAHRSKLFVPGNRPERFDKAMTSGADAIAIDLEDAVPDAENEAARRAVANLLERLESGPTEIGVRLNGRLSGFMIDDLMAVVRPGLFFRCRVIRGFRHSSWRRRFMLSLVRWHPTPAMRSSGRC